MLGDQLAKVGISVLVYQRTHSAALTAITFAMTLLPDLLAGPLLAPLADRFPRRTVMVTCAAVQAALAATRAVPGLPIAAIAVLVAMIAAGQAPYKAAQAAVVRDVLDRGMVKSGQVRLTMIREAGQLVGLGGAAAIVGLVGPSTAVVLDAVSFALAAALVRFGVTRKPAPARVARNDGRRCGLRIIQGDRRLRALTWLALAGSMTILPDAVIVPLTREAGAPNWVVGPLLAADSVGFLVAARVVDRYCSPARQRGLIGALAMLSLLALVPFVLRPGPIAIGALLAVSGAGASYLPLLRGEVVELAPDEVLGAVTGWIRTALRAGQGAAALLAGALAQWLDSGALAVGLAGLVAAACAGAAARSWQRSRTSTAAGIA
ncbi:MAG: MFS transporter [Sciscionella sp.]